MKHHKLTLGTIALALLTTACMDMEEEPTGDDTDETATLEQGSWTTWYNLSNNFNSAVVRVCKTSTRINWEFGYNTYTRAQTGGGGLSYITSSIAGQTWGSRYRTRGSATSFEISLGTEQAPNVAGVVFPIGSIPGC